MQQHAMVPAGRGVPSDFMGAEELIYYIQLLFPDEQSRDFAYGRELRVPHRDFTVVVVGPGQIGAYEVLYRQKTGHGTGKRKGGFIGIGGSDETVLSIDMVVSVPAEQYLDALLGDRQCGDRRRVTQASILLTTESSYSGEQLKHLQEELSTLCGQKVQSLVLEGNTLQGQAPYQSLHAFIVGAVRDVLPIYDHARNRGYNYHELKLGFQ